MININVIIFFILFKGLHEVLKRKVKIFTNIKNIMEALVGEQKEEAVPMDKITVKVKLFNDFYNLLSKAQNLLMAKEITLQIEVCVYDTNLPKVSWMELIQ